MHLDRRLPRFGGAFFVATVVGRGAVVLFVVFRRKYGKAPRQHKLRLQNHSCA
jgi:hypothetical protein